ncbi:MAG TPA: RNA-binding S4 domain-containing protein [Vicinamibacteria bacterium]|nr:RNA-binding S4 domain-containing protein [Vicinamibacteria bacterium]
MSPGEAAAGAVPEERLDLWLDIACLFKTRSEAQRACRGGKVDVNGQAAPPNRVVRPGDQVVITRGGGRRQTVIVRGTAPRHVPRAQARQLYEDRTPPPTPQEIEARQFERAMRSATPPTVPHRRDRRILRRLKGRSD